MAEDIIDHYLNQDAILQYWEYSYATSFSKCIKIRWEDVMVEAVNILDEYILCTGKVMTKEVVTAGTFASGTPRGYVIIWKAMLYSVVQAKVQPGIAGDDVYTELLVAPIG